MRQQKAPIDYQLDYMEHLFFSIKHKKTESYVIHRIWDKLDDTSILFKGQQEVLLPNGKHALADLYLPQLNIFVEVNEPYHENQVEEDEYRNTNIVNLTHGDLYIIRCGKPEKKGEWRTLEEIHQQIDECVACIKEKITQSRDSIKPWNMSKWLTVEYHKEKGILNVEDQDCLRTIDDICPYSILPQSSVVFKEWELLLCLARRILRFGIPISTIEVVGVTNSLMTVKSLPNTTKMTKSERSM